MNYIAYLHQVVNEDVKHLHLKQKTYQDSWKRRGGVGAWMMATRKMDRLEVMLKAIGYDIFAAIRSASKGEDGTVLSEIRDLRRYLILIEAEMMAEGVIVEKKKLTDLKSFQAIQAFESEVGVRKEVNYPGTPEDGGHHSKFQD